MPRLAWVAFLSVVLGIGQEGNGGTAPRFFLPHQMVTEKAYNMYPFDIFSLKVFYYHLL